MAQFVLEFLRLLWCTCIIKPQDRSRSENSTSTNKCPELVNMYVYSQNSGVPSSSSPYILRVTLIAQPWR